jgi:hypothetical protein
VIKGGEKGTFNVVGQLVSANTRRGSEHTVLSLRLGGGEIEASGAHGLAESFTLPVVGGTGSYAGVHGTVAMSSQAGDKEKLIVNLN